MAESQNPFMLSLSKHRPSLSASEEGRHFDKLSANGIGLGVKQLGFTLLEVMVALVVFSLAALALVKLQGVTLRTTADLDQRTLAQIVARNIEVETLTDVGPPALGQTQGVAANGGRQFAWTQQVTTADDSRLVRVDVSVSGGVGTSPAVLSFVRRSK